MLQYVKYSEPMEHKSFGFCAHKQETTAVTASLRCTAGVELGQKSRAAQYRQWNEINFEQSDQKSTC